MAPLNPNTSFDIGKEITSKLLSATQELTDLASNPQINFTDPFQKYIKDALDAIPNLVIEKIKEYDAQKSKEKQEEADKFLVGGLIFFAIVIGFLILITCVVSCVEKCVRKRKEQKARKSRMRGESEVGSLCYGGSRALGSGEVGGDHVVPIERW